MVSRLTIKIQAVGEHNVKVHFDSEGFSTAEIVGMIELFKHDILEGKAHVVRAGKQLGKKAKDSSPHTI